MIIFRSEITSEVIETVKDTVKVICRMGVGYDNLNVPLLKKHGIMGFNIPDYCIDEVSTATSALLLALERGVIPQNRIIASGKFDPYGGPMPRRLRNLTLGIVGVGRIGKSLAQKMSPFFRNIIGFDPYVAADNMIGYGVKKVDTLSELASQSDVVCIHCVLSKPREDEFPTEGMINKEFFNQMKNDATIINCARGAIIDMEALYNALRNNEIAGAGLDVFKPENPNDDEIGAKLVRLPNVLAMCHRAWLSKESEMSQRKRAIQGVVEALETGKPPSIGQLA